MQDSHGPHERLIDRVACATALSKMDTAVDRRENCMAYSRE